MIPLGVWRMSDSDSDIFSPHTHILFNPTVFLRIFQVGSDPYNVPNHDIPMLIIMTIINLQLSCQSSYDYRHILLKPKIAPSPPDLRSWQRLERRGAVQFILPLGCAGNDAIISP